MLALGFGLNANAQSSKVLAPEYSGYSNQVQNPTEDLIVLPAKGPRKAVSGLESTTAITTVKMGSSANVFSVLLSYQSCMYYQPDLNLIAFTHRQAPGNVGGTGIIQTTFSTNNGAAWDTTKKLMAGVGSNRYPSGVIYNPAGNTNPQNAFAIQAGPSINDGTGTPATTWASSFFFSMKLSGTNQEILWDEHTLTPFNESIGPRTGMTVDNQGRIRILGYTVNGTSFDGAYVYTGIFNSPMNKWDWTSKAIPGTNMNYYGATLTMAWSNDGNTGFVTAVGIDSTAPVAQKLPYPHIWKTTDAGTTWTKQPFFDFATIPAFADSLTPLTTGGVRPFFLSAFGMDAIVDYQNNLHLVYGIAAAYSNNPDSTTYNYNFASGRHIYDIYQSSTGCKARHMYKFQTNNITDAATSPIGQTYTARVQAGKSTDSKKIFVTFTDTDPNLTPSGLNELPDIFVAAWDVETNKPAQWNDGGVWTKYKNVTVGTNIEGSCYYHYMAKNIGKTGTKFNVHASYTRPNSTDPANAWCEHFYVKGIEVDETDFRWATSVNEISTANFSVSQNYPNPSNGSTSVNVTLVKAANVAIAVTNVIGQQLFTKTYNNLGEGMNRLDLNLSLKAGTYFYNVTVDGKTVTNKMLVK